MPQELECKIKLPNIAAVTALREQIGKIGANFHGEVFEQNWMFDRNGELLAKHEVLRLRVVNNERGGVITYKSAPTGGFYKVREEIETAVADAENWRKIIGALGLAAARYYEKKRASWEYRDFHIVIDELPQMGFFSEIEAPTVADLETLIAQLQLDRAANTNQSYAGLWAEFCAAQPQFSPERCSFDT